MKKKIAFCLYNLDVGGIETAFLSLLKFLDFNKYDVTVILEKKEGVFLEEVPKEVKIINYNLSENKNVVIRKITNRLKLIYHIIKYHNKFDFAGCYGTTRKVGATLTPYLSKNSAIWIHGNFCSQYNDEELRNFLNYINIKKFKKIIMVSHAINTAFRERNIIFDNAYIIKSFIDYKNILKLADENQIKKRRTTFVNVSRHEEKDKNLLMLLKCVKRLVLDGYSFDLWMVGDGEDHQMYQDYVKENNLNDVVHFFGKQKNPFIYYKAADATVICSWREGGPNVFPESKVLGKPVITTRVSDSLIDIDSDYGIVTDFTEDAYYNGLKQFLDHGFTMKNFDAEKFNNEILDKLNKVIAE